TTGASGWTSQRDRAAHGTGRRTYSRYTATVDGKLAPRRCGGCARIAIGLREFYVPAGTCSRRDGPRGESEARRAHTYFHDRDFDRHWNHLRSRARASICKLRLERCVEAEQRPRDFDRTFA